MFAAARREDGFALVTAIGVSFTVLMLSVVAVGISVHNADQSAQERRRLQAIDAAESGIYYYLSYLQSTGGAQPVCSITQNITGAGAASESFTATPTFYNGTGGVLSCPAGGSLAAGVVPAAVLIHASGKVSSLANPVRAMESYAVLTPTQGSNFGSKAALLAQTNVTFQANAQVGGSQYSDADIYSNGSISVAANSTLYGNVYAQGTVTLQAGSEVKKSVYANGSITLSGNARIRGNATSSTSFISMSGQSTIYGYAKAATTVTGGTVLGARTPSSPSAAPPTQAYPTFTYTQADWMNAGYTPHPYTNDCTTPVTNIGTWWSPAAAGTSHVIRMTGTCTINLASATIKGNLAIITDGSVTLANNATLTPSGGPWNLYIFAGLAGAGGCSYSDGTNSAIAPGINTLIYTPSACSVTLSNNSSLSQGQIISGTITAKKSLAFQFATVPVPGGGGGGFKEDVTYIREVIGP
jgi:hypothetical protein